MRDWALRFSPDAVRDLQKLDRSAYKLAVERVEWLKVHFDSLTPLPLHAEWGGHYKWRAGDYRIIYTINYSACILYVEHVRHRDRVYKRK
ncbi:MAG: type II toxin-antitoxin system RelE/ParE family toxin [bacterium]